MEEPLPLITDTDDLVNNIMDGKDLTDFSNQNNRENDEISQSNGSSSIGNYQIFNANNQLIGFHCEQVMVNNPNLVDIPLVFYIDMKFPTGKEWAAKRRIQSELLLAIARDFRITTGKACTDPPPNGSSWLVSIKSELRQITKEETFPKCRELAFDERTEECYVYQFELVGNVLTGKKMPDVEAVVETLFVNSVQKSIGTDFGVKFLGIPQYENDGGETIINPPSNLEGGDIENNPLNRQNFTIVGGFLVAAFCFATAAILLILYKRRKAQQIREQELERSPKHFSQDTEDEEYDNEVPEQHLYPLDLGNSFNQQVLGAHTPYNTNTNNNNTTNRGPTKYLTNVNPNQGPYSHFYGQPQTPQPRNVKHRRNGSNQSADVMSQSTVDSWAQTNATIGSLELQMEPITGEI